MKHNYLNNKDILKEIHKSKTTYCSYTKPEYADYDMIVTDLKKINKTNTLQARRNRAERLAKLAHEEACKDGVKRKLDEFEVMLVVDPWSVVTAFAAFDAATSTGFLLNKSTIKSSTITNKQGIYKMVLKINRNKGLLEKYPPALTVLYIIENIPIKITKFTITFII